MHEVLFIKVLGCLKGQTVYLLRSVVISKMP